MPTMEDIESWRGDDARGSDGDKLGRIEAICLDSETGKPEGIAVKTGLFGGQVSFGPPAEARLDGDAVQGRGQGRRGRRADGQLSHPWRRRT